MNEILEKRYLTLKEEIKDKAKLIIVSKTRTLKEIEFYYHLGQRDFGENRVEELLEKSAALSRFNDIRWHFIGNIQSKKIAKLLKVKGLVLIHSVDRFKIIDEFIQKKIQINFMLQVNISQEEEKSGFDPEEVSKAYQYCLHYGLNVKGLMGMATLRAKDQKMAAKRDFKWLRDIRDHLRGELELSMGMSQDYQEALEYGSNWLRIGSYLFDL